MASPQKENGFTPIANELFEAFYCCKLLEYERVCIMHIWRKTYGWSKKDDWIANSQFAEETGIPRPHVTRTLKKLLKKKIIIKDSKKVTVNKNYEEWEVEWRVTSSGNRVTSSGNEKLPHQVPTKESKETITKGGEESPTNLLDKNKPMGWNKQSEDFDEGVVDYDSGELTKPEEEAKGKNREQNARKKELVDWLIVYQKRDPLRTNRSKQLKALNRLIEMRVTGAEAQQIIMEEMQSEFWREKKEKPDFCTVVAVIEKRGE